MWPQRTLSHAQGPNLKISYTSKNFVAYIEDLVGPTPYYKTTDSRNKLDVCFTKALNDLNKMDYLRFEQYVLRRELRKVRAWYAQFLLTPRVGGTITDAGHLSKIFHFVFGC